MCVSVCLCVYVSIGYVQGFAIKMVPYLPSSSYIRKGNLSEFVIMGLNYCILLWILYFKVSSCLLIMFIVKKFNIY